VALRFTLVILGLLLAGLQYRLWLSDDGFREVARLSRLTREQQSENAELTSRNRRLEAEIADLRDGGDAVEEQARVDLGLIGERETFFVLGPAESGPQQP
jgi:cell division protein FtsB